MRLLFQLFLLFLLAVSAPLSDARNNKIVSKFAQNANHRKAAYLFLSAQDAKLQNNFNLYNELISRSYSLNPQDPDLMIEKGEWDILSNPNDSALIASGFNLMLQGYDSTPPNFEQGIKIAALTQKFQRWNDYLKISEKISSQFPNRNEASFRLAQAYMIHALLGDTAYVKPAIATLNKLEQKVGFSPQLTEMKINVLSSKNDTLGINREIELFAASSPSDPQTNLAVAQLYESTGQNAAALNFYNKACDLDPENGNSILMRAQFLLREQGDSTTFQQEAIKAMESIDLDFETKFQFVADYIRTHLNDSTSHPRIVSLLETLQNANSGEPDAFKLYADYLLHIGHAQGAAEQMSYAVSLEPNSRNNWLALTQMYGQAGNYTQAAKAAHNGATHFPNESTFPRIEASYLSLNNNYTAAAEVLTAFPDSLITDPDEKSLFKTTLGDIFYKLKRVDNAFALYDEALTLNPNNYLAMNNVAYFYAETDTLLDKAEDYIVRALRHSPQSPTTIDTYAWVLYKKGNFQEARRQIDRALEIMNFKTTAQKDDAELQTISVSGPNDTTQELESGIDGAAEPHAEVLDHAGDIYFRCGDTVQAVEFWQEALKREPENPTLIKKKIKQRKIVSK